MAIERWRPGWGLAPWRPLGELEEMERRFEDAFDQTFPAIWRRHRGEERGWAPPIEMFEKEDSYTLKAELPGMKKDEIDVSVTGDTLTIKGERKAETETREEDYYCCERSYGSFFRSIKVPTAVDTEKIEANYQDGVLELTLPKAPEAKPKKIDVAVKS